MPSGQQRRFLESDEAYGHAGTLWGHGGLQAWGSSRWAWAGGGCPATISAPHASDTAVWLQLMVGLGSQEETWVPSLSQEDPLEEGMATQSSMLAQSIPRTEEPTGSQRVGRA